MDFTKKNDKKQEKSTFAVSLFTELLYHRNIKK